MRALLAALLLAASPCFADLIVRNPQAGAELRLMNTQCSHAETLAHIPPPMRAEFKDARFRSQGGMVYGCWVRNGDDGILVLEDGSAGMLDLREFSESGV